MNKNSDVLDKIVNKNSDVLDKIVNKKPTVLNVKEKTTARDSITTQCLSRSHNVGPAALTIVISRCLD